MQWGNPDALMEAAEGWRDALVRALMAGGASLHDAQDAASRAVLAARRSHATDWRTFRAYVNRCAHNALMDRYRETTLPDDTKALLVADARLVPSDPTAVLVEAMAVRAEVDALPERQREAVYLVSEGASVQDVADAQGTTYKAAEGLLARARATVRERVGTTYGGIAALLRPGAARRAVVAVPVLTLGALGLLVVRVPAQPDSPAAPLSGRPGAVAVAPRRPPVVRETPPPAPSSVPPVVAPTSQRPTLPLAQMRPVVGPPNADDDDVQQAAPPLYPRKPRDGNGYTLPEQIVHCVQHLEVPPRPEVCAEHA